MAERLTERQRLDLTAAKRDFAVFKRSMAKLLKHCGDDGRAPATIEGFLGGVADWVSENVTYDDGPYL